MRWVLPTRLLCLAAPIVFASTACPIVDAVALARPKTWSPLCGHLAQIKHKNEAPGGDGWSTPTDEFGTKAYAAAYSKVERLAPEQSVSTLFEKARPLLGHGVFRPTAAVRRAIPSAKTLRSIIERHCQLEISDVFKVGF